MKKKLPGNEHLLRHLGDASKNMVQHHYRDNLSEFMLHDLCSQNGFHLYKAAYLINNPDFACLKGVAGYYHPEIFQNVIWENPKDFTSHMKKASFNQKVRAYLSDDIFVKEKNDLSKKKIYDLIDYLEIKDPVYHTWNAKHNNQGIFLFERPLDHVAGHEHLFNFLHLLSFCPIF
ncbi:hypothetical protein HYV11_01775 [Candidatus Dependentiae bacterium]|nr:hypothetical protein [Candidatus Dependentiae bacterium]